MTTVEAVAAQPQTSSVPKLKQSFSSTYIPTLDGWRAIAIAIVLFAHGCDSIIHTLGSWAQPIRDQLYHSGLFGVRIFFGISGFLITSRLISELRNEREGSMKRFYIRRAFRILPPALAFLLVVGLLMLTGFIPSDPKGWLAALLFCANYVKTGWYVGHFWSLAVEEHFYLLWPILLALMGTRRGFSFAVIVAGAVALWRAIRFYTQWHIDGTAWGTTDFQLDGLLWGAAFACLCSSRMMLPILTRLVSGYRGYLFSGLFLATIAAPYTNWKIHLVIYTLQAIMIPLMLLSTALDTNKIASHILESKILRWIGHISYSLYLWQQIFLATNNVRQPQMGILQTWPLNFFLVFACAATSYYLIEQPMIRFGRRFTKSESKNKQTHAMTASA